MVFNWICYWVVPHHTSDVCNGFVMSFWSLFFHLLNYVLSQILLNHFVLLSHHIFSFKLSSSIFLNLRTLFSLFFISDYFLHFLLVQLLSQHQVSCLHLQFFSLLIGILLFEKCVSLHKLIFNKPVVLFCFLFFKIEERTSYSWDTVTILCTHFIYLLGCYFECLHL